MNRKTEIRMREYQLMKCPKPRKHVRAVQARNLFEKPINRKVTR